MTEIANATSYVLAIGVILAQLAILDLLIFLAFRKSFTPLYAMVKPYILPLALLATLAGSALTLVYSEVFGMIPCFLCWLQRAFLYPMPIILAFGLWRGFESAWKWVAALAVPGTIVALYQHYLQMGGSAVVACPAISGAADCSKRLIFEFGYITFPLMAATIFVLVFLMMLAYGYALKVSQPSASSRT